MLGAVVHAFRLLRRLGLLHLSPLTALRLVLAWRRCGASLAFLAEAAAVRFGRRLALRDDEGQLTFDELRVRYEALAHRLITEFGVSEGGCVALIERNHRTFVVALLAAARAGADVVLMNPDSPPRLLADRVASIAPHLVMHGANIDIGDCPATQRRLALISADLVASKPQVLPRVRRVGRLVLSTSGSTGMARSVARQPTLASVLPPVLGLLVELPITLHRSTVLAVPLFHGHGLATLALAFAFAAPVHLGRCVEIAPLLAREPAPSDAIVVSVPTLLARWLVHRPVAGCVSAVVTGSAPLGPSLCLQLLGALGRVVHNLYGSTEAGVISLATPAMLVAAPGTVGKPLPRHAVRITCTANRTVAPGELGRVEVRGPLVLTAASDGWLDTGDVGRIDEAGRLHICGRSDDMFVSGGENVYPHAVEARLLEHPGLLEAAIAVVPDTEFGQRMRAFVVGRPGASLSPVELRAWLGERVERFQMPRSIEVVAALPRNELGKIDRATLRALPAS